MASVPVTIDGVLYDKYGRTVQVVQLVGQATLTGLGVGGGPIIPDTPPAQPPGGVPIHPIWGPPGFNPPGAGMPPGIGGGPIIPPSGPVDPGYSPPWAQVPAVPTFPIAGYPDRPYPGQPIYMPGYPGGAPPPNLPPGWGQGPPTQPPTPPTEGKPPPPEGGWGWHPDYGWGYFPGGGGKPQPQP